MSKTFNTIKTKIILIISKRPFVTVFIAIGLLVGFLLIGKSLDHKNTEVKQENVVKTVSVYHIGKAPRLNFQAQIEKEGVVTIVAQTTGVVNYIYKSAGALIDQGTPLIALSTNYQGGNTATLQKQIALKQYNTLVETYQTQKDIISTQREIAKKSDDNSDELRTISERTLSNLNDQLDLNEEILNTLDQNITTLEQAGNTPDNQSLILQTKQLKTQYLSAVGQLKTSIRTTEYQTDSDKNPSKLSNLSKKVTLMQLDIQEKALDLNKEISELSLNIAKISESLMYPATPFAGRVERVFVKPGQKIDAGTQIAVISGNTTKSVAVVRVPSKTAGLISKIEDTEFTVGQNHFSLKPRYVSSQATDGQLYTVIYDIPQEYEANLSNGEFINVSIPIGYADTGSATPFIPLDAVSQTQNETTVYVVNNNTVAFRNVKLGNVVGRFVEVNEGLSDGDIVILDRDIVVGDQIKFQNE